MPEIDKAEVYRKAAEIIIRDGKHEAELVRNDRGIPEDEALKDPSRPVCALGACARAEYELYGTLPKSAYERYGFKVPKPSPHRYSGIYWQPVQYFNDDDSTSAEDVALALKREAGAWDGA
ncbi:hypothetical protein [Streptomyces sp. NPDC057854]|uniref:DUF6197 family protein n=1 Tax=unclassified Streptomyces TaxID=2593676 RepID=UPI0036A3F7DB